VPIETLGKGMNLQEMRNWKISPQMHLFESDPNFKTHSQSSAALTSSSPLKAPEPL
jgi:hypothetical protein